MDPRSMVKRQSRPSQAASEGGSGVWGIEGGGLAGGAGIPSSVRTVVLFMSCKWSMRGPRVGEGSTGGGVAPDQAFERALPPRDGPDVAGQAGVVVDRERDRVHLEGELGRICGGIEFAGVDRLLHGAGELLAPGRLERQQAVADRSRAVV